jgi:hypothetical protein
LSFGKPEEARLSGLGLIIIRDVLGISLHEVAILRNVRPLPSRSLVNIANALTDAKPHPLASFLDQTTQSFFEGAPSAE